MLRDGFLNLSHNAGLLISNVVPFSYICAEIEKQWGSVPLMIIVTSPPLFFFFTY